MTRHLMPRFLCGLALLALALAIPTPAAAGSAQGFIYGRVTTDDGDVHEGRLRWSDEEAFWGDFFNSTKEKEDRPYLEEIPEDQRRRGTPIKIFGLTVGTHYENSGSARMLKIRFGDIAELRPRGGDRATMVLKDGSQFELDGGSNDLGATIHVSGGAAGDVEIEWGDIESIEFSEAPAGLEVREHRLHGTVVTEVGEFRGFIQWDKHECVSSDKLDGENDDGDHALEMGSIRSIERASYRGSLVTLRDGRELLLEGTNDVNDENRGIFVEDPRFGRLLVSWDAFERIDFSDLEESGPGYGEYKPGTPLRGAVTDVDGTVHRGRIVYDLDESATWEFLDGDSDDISYSVPMGLVSSIEPRKGGSLVALKSGEKLDLGGAADVDEDNDGIAIVDGDETVYVAWERVRRVDFE
jgi:hypothetical protein